MNQFFKRPIQYHIPQIVNYEAEEEEYVPEPIKTKAKQKAKKMIEKKDNEPWDPDDYNGLEETLQSLSVFNTWRKEDGTKMSLKEKRESFNNFDKWIDEKAMEYQEEYKKKENAILY